MKIEATKREISGKKVKNLRSTGSIPASLFGRNLDSKSIEVNTKDFRKLFAGVGHNIIFDIHIKGEDKPVKALVKEVQRNPVTDEILHVGFYQLDMSKPIDVEVPIEIIGVSSAVKNNIGFLVTPFEEIKISCLPTEIPEKIIVDISKLDNIGDSVKVSDIQLSEHVRFHSSISEEDPVARIVPPQKEEVVVETAPAEGETAEGETPAEGGEAKAEGDAAAAPAEGEKK